MFLIFLGGPGSGKGTQSKSIATQYGLAHLSTGDILRREVEAKTELGREVSSILQSGRLVNDKIIFDLLRKTIAALSADVKGIILDGFPRTIEQADMLSTYLTESSLSINHVFFIDVPRAMLADRLTGRFSCRACGAGYHKTFKPTKAEGECDLCGAKAFSSRDDDKLEVVMDRLQTYEISTAPLLSYYREKNLVRMIDGSIDIPLVSKQISDYINASTH